MRTVYDVTIVDQTGKEFYDHYLMHNEPTIGELVDGDSYTIVAYDEADRYTGEEIREYFPHINANLYDVVVSGQIVVAPNNGLVKVMYEDILVGEIATNKSLTVGEALELISFSEENFAEEHGFDDIDYNDFKLVY